eukprot:s363_g31.t1
MADFQVKVIEECEAQEPEVFYWVENPGGSFLWRQRGFRERFSKPDSKWLFRADYCRFGTPWRKRTRVCNNIPGLQGLRMMCCCEKNHVQLRGQHPVLKIPWTSVAQPYPRGFSKVIASSILSATGWSAKLDIAGCARCGSLRVGEASHPGPRQVRGGRNFSLEEAPVQSWTSLHVGERRWEMFLAWCRTFLSEDPLSLFFQVPLFLAHAVRKCGNAEFKTGGSLMYFRHLVLAAQRRVPTLRPYVSICRDLASRWEKAEPTQHRSPVPEVLVQALVALGWCLGWKRRSSVTLLCFHGVVRVGEVLKCKRSDLLLPADMMFECDAAIALLRQSKTMYRQSARVQYLNIVSNFVVLLLTLALCDADRDEQLFHGSPQFYRQRWNYLLKLLKVSEDLRITPGGLRGGGAVCWYRKDGSISDLLWAMRLKNISTLESSLLAVSAISLLTDLSYEARHAIRCAASLFWHLDHSLGAVAQAMKDLDAAKASLERSETVLNSKKDAMGAGEAARSVKKEVDELSKRLQSSKDTVTKCSKTLEESRGRGLRRAAAEKQRQDWESSFARHDLDGDGCLSRAEVEAFGKGEFEIELPEDVLDHIMRVLEPIRFEKFLSLRQKAS